VREPVRGNRRPAATRAAASGIAAMNGRQPKAQPSTAPLPRPRPMTGAPEPSPPLSNLALQRALRSGALRAKLAVGRADDPSEDEADRVAEQVMQGGPCVCGGTCAKCGGDGVVRRQAAGPGGSASARTAAFFVTGSGRALPRDLRAYFEPQLGADLGAVRLHDDRRAAATARDIAANAFTAGNDIGFAEGQFAPETSPGRKLLAHDLVHVVQNDAATLRRQPAPGAAPAPAPAAPGPGPAGQAATPGSAPSPAAEPPAPRQAPPGPNGEIVKTLDGVPLVEDPAFMRYQLEQLVMQGSGDSYNAFLMRLEHDVETDEMAGDRKFKKEYEENPSGVSAGVPRSQEDFDAYDQMKEKERRVLDIVRTVATTLDAERNKLDADFENIAKDQARTLLDKSEKQEQSEADRYGIKWQTIERMQSDCLAGDCTYSQTTYSMGEQSPADAGLQGAALLLLQRRNELNEASNQLDQVRRESLDRLASCAGEGGGSYAMECPGSEDLAKHREGVEATYKKKKDGYDLIRGFLSEQYPILAVFSDPEKSASDLKALATQKAGPEMAALLGKEIVDRLGKITKVRNGLDNSKEVNVWRLPPLMAMTRELMGVNAKPVWKKWIDEKTESEQPGIFWSIALAVLNLAAIIAAPFTGGLSLVAAAGVNAVAAVQHVKEYQMQKALAGTAFDKANALSQDDPSFFWLAVEIVGVAVDAVSAFKAVSAAAKAYKAAEELGDAKRIADAAADVRKATDFPGGGEKLAGRVIAQLARLIQRISPDHAKSA